MGEGNIKVSIHVLRKIKLCSYETSTDSNTMKHKHSENEEELLGIKNMIANMKLRKHRK